jgi:EPS-associated MarR family transcriptional regulator
MHEQSSSKASSESHLRLLRLLQANPHMTQRELAEAMGVSLGKANYCIRQLLLKGLIKMHNFSHSTNKLRYAYLLTPSGVTAKARLTAEYIKIKTAEYESLKREIQQLRVEASRSHVNGYRQ